MTCKHFTKLGKKYQDFQKNLKLLWIYFLVSGSWGHSRECHVILRKVKCLSFLFGAWSPQLSILFTCSKLNLEHPVLTKLSKYEECHGNHKISSEAVSQDFSTYQSVELSNADVLWIHHCILFPRHQVQSQLSRKQIAKVGRKVASIEFIKNNLFLLHYPEIRYITRHASLTHTFYFALLVTMVGVASVTRLDTGKKLRNRRQRQANQGVGEGMSLSVESSCNGEEHSALHKPPPQKPFHIRLGWKPELDIILFLEIRVEERGAWSLAFDLAPKYLVMAGANSFLMWISGNMRMVVIHSWQVLGSVKAGDRN